MLTPKTSGHVSARNFVIANAARCGSSGTLAGMNKPFLPVELDRGAVSRQRAKSFVDALIFRGASGESSTDAVHRAEMGFRGPLSHSTR